MDRHGAATQISQRTASAKSPQRMHPYGAGHLLPRPVTDPIDYDVSYDMCGVLIEHWD